MSAIIFYGVLILVAVYGIFVYNQLVSLKHNVNIAWANIDVLMKQRHDELPKLVDACKQYMDREQETLEKVMLARAQVAAARRSHDVAGLGKAEEAMKSGLGRLFAIAEAYPELKTNETFMHLQARISSLENAVADRREFYNDLVHSNNVRIEQFPDSMIASLFRFEHFPLLKFGQREEADINIHQIFSA